MNSITEKIDKIIADNDARVAYCQDNNNFDDLVGERLQTVDKILALFQELLNEIKNA